MNEILNAEQLADETIAIKVAFTKPGTTKSFKKEEKSRVAHEFFATIQAVRASKKILDTKHPSYKACTSAKGAIASYIASMTIPYPEPGVRLLRRERLEVFQQTMDQLVQTLHEAAVKLQDDYESMIEDAKNDLGTLFDRADYPDRIDNEWGAQWWPVSVNPPEYLRKLNPALYEQARLAAQSRFADAITMAEQAFLEEFAKLSLKLTDLLTPGEDGKPRKLHDSAIENLNDFFARFRNLKVGDNKQLEEMIAQCESVLGGVSIDALRTDDLLRDSLRASLEDVVGELRPLVEVKHNRAIRLEEETVDAA